MPIVNLNDQAELARYEAFVESASFTSVTQSVNWGKVKNNWQPLYVYLEDGGVMTAAMSILSVTDPAGDTFAYCSKGPVCDPTDLETIDALVAEATPALQQRNAFLLRMDPEVLYSQALNDAFEKRGYVVRNRDFHGNHDTIQPRMNFVVDIQGKTIEDVIAGMKSNERTKMRHAMKTGVEVQSGDSPELMADFFETYKAMSEYHGITYRPEAYFQRMVEAFQGTGQMKIYNAWYEGELHAGAVAFAFGDKVWHMYGGSKRIENKLLVPYRLQYEMIDWACQLGKAKYDMGGVWGTDNSDGLYNFKHRFAPQQDVIEYLGEIDRVWGQAAYDRFTK
ncbi:lipid II:glycine glycyltransferase FemX [Lacticaseibacillus daqingensis]|uniref:lipid II:glycine glycyltransferase FemX n=1 Tax=Lacticaseibacillus daqingensis TaxID=2486014 RepID=UPI000F7A1DC3|nr:peptidoglycan bridge formation glycyltransferase FemA/FemB family protein [Lacticaseibacillus daqingensis]